MNNLAKYFLGDYNTIAQTILQFTYERNVYI